MSKEDAVAALKRFGVALRAYGESDPETMRLWREAVQAQADYRKASYREYEKEKE